MNAIRLLKDARHKIARQAHPEDIMRGSLVMVERTCGKPNCRCVKGHKHRSLYLSQYHKGSPRMIYIPKRAQEDARRMVRNYQMLKGILNKVSDANMRLITLHKGKSR
jgi:hypothetical protein